MLLVPPFRAGREVDHVAGGVGHVGVQADLPLPVAAEIERGGRVGAERGVDRVGDEQIGFVSPDRAAHVPDDAGRSEAADATHKRQVLRLTAEARREAARKPLPERETVRVVEHLLQGDRVGDVIGDGHRRAVRRAGACRHERVADQQRLAAVEAEDAALRVRVSEEEAAGHFFTCVVGVAVDLQAVVEQVSEVPE